VNPGPGGEEKGAVNFAIVSATLLFIVWATAEEPKKEEV
jgi:hypothetical protein